MSPVATPDFDSAGPIAAPAFNASSTIADVLVFRGVGALYSYAIPPELAESVFPGVHVDVPFGPRAIQGVVLNCHSTVPTTFAVKPITGLHTKKPNVPETLLALIRWLQDEYQLTPFKAYQTVIGEKVLRKLSGKPEKPVLQIPDHVLNPEQAAAVDAVLKGQAGTEFCLFGITGSGKTEVYIHLAREVLKQGRQVLIMLPEIALTPQVREIFMSRFGHATCVIHSGLTKKERDLAWTRVYERKADIVIGPRSAIFSPFTDLGLIVIDEEHEPSYKQENNPRYLTHTIARFRNTAENAKLVYGSATPSISTWFRAIESGSHDTAPHVLKLTERAMTQSLPEVQVLDMRDEYSQGSYPLIAKPLQNAIAERLAAKEKIIMFINRRGYAPFIICARCGNWYTCPSCNMSYTYHNDKKYRCHRCGTTADITMVCPKCRKKALTFGGTGIQKVETELLRLFPGVNIVRMDRDEIKNVTDLEAALNRFQAEGEILLGTQLIAKGHHFPDVTLVGVIGIDTVLNIPDFQSAERAFQLLTQVAGRAGRAEKKGFVIVQTTQPEHYAIVHARQHDFEGFYARETGFRQALWYPPYSHLLNVVFSSLKADAVRQYALSAGEYLKTALAGLQGRTQMIGPKPAPVEMIQNHMRWNLMIKAEHRLVPEVKLLLAKLPECPASVRMIMDFDPKSIL